MRYQGLYILSYAVYEEVGNYYEFIDPSHHGHILQCLFVTLRRVEWCHVYKGMKKTGCVTEICVYSLFLKILCYTYFFIVTTTVN